MTRHPFLESFDRGTASIPGELFSAESLEQAKSEAFEAGYATGWEDAVASDKTSKQRVEAEFERNVQNLSLTFAQAVAHVREELDAFVGALVHHLLPAILPRLLREHVRAEVLSAADEVMDKPVQIIASPDSMSILADMFANDPAQSIELVEDASLARCQVHVRLGSRESEVNLDRLITALADQFDALHAASSTGKTNDA